MDEFAHVDGDTASMVDVGDKPDAHREAVASGSIDLQPATVEAMTDGEGVKDNVLATARVAAIQAVKRTWDDIPMCHQIPISNVDVDVDVREASVEARVAVKSTGKTGVEMEALNGVSRALLTVWDMVKAAEKTEDGQYPDTVIGDVRVEAKRKTVPEEESEASE
jgi:cyclic pyranopterin phosphate synthase